MAIGKPGQPAASKSGGIGLGLENWAEGTGLMDDFDGTILEAAFVKWDYDGKYDPGLFLALEIRNDEIEANDGSDGKPKNPFVQYYSAGSLEHFVPSDDGKEAIPVGSKTGLSKSTNAFIVIASMIQAGFDPSLVGNSVGVFEGAKFHWKRVAGPDRNIKDDKKKGGKEDDEKKKKSEVLCAESLISMPGEATKVGPGPKAAGPKPPTATGPKATGPAAPPKPPTTGPKAVPPVAVAAAALPDETVQGWAAAYIIEKLAESGGSHPKAGLAKDLVNWAKPHIEAKAIDIPFRNKVVQALGNEAFLSKGEELGLGWAFDGETLTLAQ